MTNFNSIMASYQKNIHKTKKPVAFGDRQEWIGSNSQKDSAAGIFEDTGIKIGMNLSAYVVDVWINAFNQTLSKPFTLTEEDEKKMISIANMLLNKTVRWFYELQLQLNVHGDIDEAVTSDDIVNLMSVFFVNALENYPEVRMSPTIGTYSRFVANALPDTLEYIVNNSDRKETTGRIDVKTPIGLFYKPQGKISIQQIQEVDEYIPDTEYIPQTIAEAFTEMFGHVETTQKKFCPEYWQNGLKNNDEDIYTDNQGE